MAKKPPARARTAGFIEVMECLPVATFPEGSEWTYELKLDGYRMEVVREGTNTTLYSRRKNILNEKFSYVASALRSLPAGTVIDGELVAIGGYGKPNFNLLQNFRSAADSIIYYAFDILVYKERDLPLQPLSERREILRSVVVPTNHVALSEVSNHLLDVARGCGRWETRSNSLLQCGTKRNARNHLAPSGRSPIS